MSKSKCSRDKSDYFETHNLASPKCTNLPCKLKTAICSTSTRRNISVNQFTHAVVDGNYG